MTHKVCHVSTAHSPYDTRVFRKECVSLAKAGYETHFVVQGEDEIKEGVSIHGLRRPNGRLDRMTRLVNEAFRASIDLDADLYHLHDPELLRVALKFKKAGKKVVFDSHEFYRYQIAEKQYLPGPTSAFAASLYSRFEHAVCKQIDAVVVPCTRAGINPFEGCAKRTVFVDNYPILPDKCLDPDYTREDRGSICYVGSITHNRGITHLIKAGFRSGTRVVLAGPIDSSYLNELQQMAEYKCVDYRGILDSEGVQGVLKECCCGSACLLNVGQYWLGDNLPTKAYEYMAAGIPFVMSPTPYAKQFAEEVPCCLLVDPEDIDSYAEAINKLRDNPELSRKMAEAGFRALVTQYNWKTQESQLISLYETLLS